MATSYVTSGEDIGIYVSPPKSYGKVPLEKIILACSDLELKLAILEKSKGSIGLGVYFIEVEVGKWAQGYYNCQETFTSLKKARQKREEIVRELKKGDKGNYYLQLSGKGKINLRLIDYP
jgi:hypothetical protein